MYMGFSGGSEVKNLLARAEAAGEVDLITGSGRSLEGYSGWEIPWTEEPGGLQSMESQRVGHDRATVRAGIHVRVGTHIHT